MKGIGEYTAGAVSSIAYGIPVPAVDGNVLRVFSRILENYEDILKQSTKKKITEYILELMPKERAGDFNQAVMELGAMVCIPNGAMSGGVLLHCKKKRPVRLYPGEKEKDSEENREKIPVCNGVSE